MIFLAEFSVFKNPTIFFILQKLINVAISLFWNLEYAIYGQISNQNSI